MIKLNTKYRAVETGQEFELYRIITVRGTVKLTDPIYEFKYLNRDTKNFTCYLHNILRSLDFKAWEEIKWD